MREFTGEYVVVVNKKSKKQYVEKLKKVLSKSELYSEVRTYWI